MKYKAIHLDDIIKGFSTWNEYLFFFNSYIFGNTFNMDFSLDLL